MSNVHTAEILERQNKTWLFIENFFFFFPVTSWMFDLKTWRSISISSQVKCVFLTSRSVIFFSCFLTSRLTSLISIWGWNSGKQSIGGTLRIHKSIEQHCLSCFRSLQLTNRGLLTIIALWQSLQTTIARIPLLIVCMWSKKPKQFCSMYLILHSQGPS